MMMSGTRGERGATPEQGSVMGRRSLAWVVWLVLLGSHRCHFRLVAVAACP